MALTDLVLLFSLMVGAWLLVAVIGWAVYQVYKTLQLVGLV